MAMEVSSASEHLAWSSFMQRFEIFFYKASNQGEPSSTEGFIWEILQSSAGVEWAKNNP